MKREDILAMPVGRELDALVLEKIFGCSITDDYRTVGEFTVASEFALWEFDRDHPNQEPPKACLPYSTDISAAWEVVEKLCESEDVKFGIDRNYSIKNMWVAGFNYNHGSYAGHTATAAPEAICKAALLTVLEDSL